MASLPTLVRFAHARPHHGTPPDPSSAAHPPAPWSERGAGHGSSSRACPGAGTSARRKRIVAGGRRDMPVNTHAAKGRLNVCPRTKNSSRCWFMWSAYATRSLCRHGTWPVVMIALRGAAPLPALCCSSWVPLKPPPATPAATAAPRATAAPLAAAIGHACAAQMTLRAAAPSPRPPDLR